MSERYILTTAGECEPNDLVMFAYSSNAFEYDWGAWALDLLNDRTKTSRGGGYWFWGPASQWTPESRVIHDTW